MPKVSPMRPPSSAKLLREFPGSFRNLKKTLKISRIAPSNSELNFASTFGLHVFKKRCHVGARNRSKIYQKSTSGPRTAKSEKVSKPLFLQCISKVPACKIRSKLKICYLNILSKIVLKSGNVSSSILLHIWVIVGPFWGCHSHSTGVF